MVRGVKFKTALGVLGFIAVSPVPTLIIGMKVGKIAMYAAMRECIAFEDKIKEEAVKCLAAIGKS
jgi:hypothetical protein